MGKGIEFGRIGVLAGGPSSERDISLKSGKAVYGALIQEGCEAIFLDVKDDIYDIISRIKIDCAFIALHGRFGEDGTVQKILEDHNIPYTGSGPRASASALDKIASKEIFIKSGIPTPAYKVLEKGKFDIKAIEEPGLPVVIKPQFEGSSIGLSVVRSKSDLARALDEAFKYGSKALAEEFIDGRELTVGILRDRPLPVIEIVTRNKVYDYKAKYDDPGTRYLVPAPIEEEIFRKAQGIGTLAHTALGCRFLSRVDVMMDARGDLFALEVNTIPGMTERSLLPKAAAAAGLSFGKLCLLLVDDALRNKVLVNGKT